MWKIQWDIFVPNLTFFARKIEHDKHSNLLNETCPSVVLEITLVKERFRVAFIWGTTYKKFWEKFKRNIYQCPSRGGVASCVRKYWEIHIPVFGAMIWNSYTYIILTRNFSTNRILIWIYVPLSRQWLKLFWQSNSLIWNFRLICNIVF